MLMNKNHINRTEGVKLLIFVILVVSGIMSNQIMSLIAMLYVLYNMIKGDTELNFYYGLFLIPNIRIFDSLGVTFLVNILLAFPLIKYVLKYKFRINAFALFSTLAMLIIECIHIVILGNFENLFSVISCFMSMLYCLSITTNCTIDINIEKMWKYFVAGIFVSSFVYLVTNPWFTSNIIENVIVGYRFAAFASDPNYFSLYICLALAFIFTKRRYTLVDYVVLMVLVVLGLLTTSKMCLLMMAAVIMIGFCSSFLNVGNISKRYFLIISTGVLVIGILVFYDEIFMLLENFLKRAGLQGNSFDMSRFTSDRIDILKDYMKILSTNVIALVFGYGMQYHLYLHVTGGYGAHNTYFDVILSWGLVGVLIFGAVVMVWTSKLISNTKKSIIRFLPLIVLVISLLALSCLSATMFWWVISYALLIASKYKKEIS